MGPWFLFGVIKALEVANWLYDCRSAGVPQGLSPTDYEVLLYACSKPGVMHECQRVCSDSCYSNGALSLLVNQLLMDGKKVAIVSIW